MRSPLCFVLVLPGLVVFSDAAEFTWVAGTGLTEGAVAPADAAGTHGGAALGVMMLCVSDFSKRIAFPD